MGCWSDFGTIVSKYKNDYDDGELAVATLQAAIELGGDVGGFSDSHTTTFNGVNPLYSDCNRPYVAVPLPITPGWELTGIHNVMVNGVDISRLPNGTCMYYDSDCNDILVYYPQYGREPTVRVDFGVGIVAGVIGSDMPDFLFERYQMAMVWKILSLLYTMDADHKNALVYERMYATAKNKKKARSAGGNAKIDARGVLWI